jgi:hypothetical protein
MQDKDNNPVSSEVTGSIWRNSYQFWMYCAPAGQRLRMEVWWGGWWDTSWWALVEQTAEDIWQVTDSRVVALASSIQPGELNGACRQISSQQSILIAMNVNVIEVD